MGATFHIIYLLSNREIALKVDRGDWGFCRGCNGLKAHHIPCTGWACVEEGTVTNEVISRA